MKSSMILVVLNQILFGIALVEAQASQQFLIMVYYNNCEGSDAANYTLLAEGTMPSDCSQLNGGSITNQLIQSNASNQRSVISLQALARSQYAAGAYDQVETLWLATGGPLQAKYLYQKVIHLSAAYLKKCSSILGYSYVSSKSAVLLISQKLDLNIFLAPNGAFDAFKKGCTTMCRGSGYQF